MLDVTELQKAEYNEIRVNGQLVKHIWHASANGAEVSLHTNDVDAEYWVSPIKTMRTQGVALVDASGSMAKHVVVNR